MKFMKLKDNDIEKVSKLIFENNFNILKHAFGSNKKKASKRLEKLVRIGKNHYGYPQQCRYH